jgi:hypothetical protein
MHSILLAGRERPVAIQSLFPLIGGLEPTVEEIEDYVRRLKELKAGGAKLSLAQIYSARRANRPCRPCMGETPHSARKIFLHMISTMLPSRWSSAEPSQEMVGKRQAMVSRSLVIP